MSDRYHIVCALDSFKGSATSLQLGEAIATGLHNTLPDVRTTVVPVADGGEGTVAAFAASFPTATETTVPVPGPFGEPVTAPLLLLPDGTAVAEVASAAGLYFSAKTPAAAAAASSQGVGSLIKAALDSGAPKMLLGLGGSCTTDGGLGALSHLGATATTSGGAPVAAGLSGVQELANLDLTTLDSRLAAFELVLLTDVASPLTGPTGAAAMFGPQKGLTAEQIAVAEPAMTAYGNLLEQACGKKVAELPGAGAAGGLGAGLSALPNVSLASGLTTFLQAANFATLVAEADLVITGEGRLDEQSLQGKLPMQIAAIAGQQQVPVIAVVGENLLSAAQSAAAGISFVETLVPGPLSLAQAIAKTQELAIATGERLGQIVQFSRTN